MDFIYETRGKAKEYAPLSAELFCGCVHRCGYCYVPGSENVQADSFHEQSFTRQNAIHMLSADLDELASRHDDRLILLSFECDPYPPPPYESTVTRAAIKLLLEHNRRFTVLTKGGTRACRDFDLLATSARTSFGSSIVFTDQKDADIWEPGTAQLSDRIAAVKEAHGQGIATWVSIEPVISAEQAIELVQRYHSIVDHWKVGKVNYLPELEKKIDWFHFRDEIIATFRSFGADFYIKKSLSEITCLPD
jgi:DNA repair photolyase